MARPPKGKPLTMRTARLDDDVWAECQRLGKEYGTINEGIAAGQAALRTLEAQGRILPEFKNTKEAMEYVQRNEIPTVIPVAAPRSKQTWKREPRPKGDRRR